MTLDPSPSSKLHLGTAYYPEHWPESRWPTDIRLMREAGLTVARMAEFAWSTLEPAEGEFHFNWLDRAISALASHEMASVLGTPTAAPPTWFMQEHPDSLAVDEGGRRIQLGNRWHYCVNSEEFHTATRRIVSAMADHFGSNADVIGWQLDNEYNRVCYCDRCRGLFQQYLAQKFGSLDALNEHWTTVYWSQTYSAWEQIPVPVGRHNPGLQLEFKHFVTESYRRFQALQIESLRPHLRPGVWITHNLMGWYDGLDQYVMAQDLDMASWDCYVGSGYHDYLSLGSAHDLTRGLKRRNFWVLETQPGSVASAPVNNMLNKGEARVMAWHAVAHGADAVLYWQWRSALGGQEQYHGTLVDQSGLPRPFYEEVQQLGREFSAISELLFNTTVVSDVALLNSYDDRWSIQGQRHHHDFDYVGHFAHYYRALAAQNIAADVVSADSVFDGYKLVIAPTRLIVDQNQAERLRDFVARGGHLVLTLRCGMKDSYNALLPSRQPGPLANLAGVEVEEYYALLEPVPVSGDWFTGTSRLWAERLKLREGSAAQVIARYGPSNGWLDGQPAITATSNGQGRVYFVGAYLDDASQQVLVRRVAAGAGIHPVMEAPSGVEVGKRVNADGREIFILVNHERTVRLVQLPWRAYEHLSKQIAPDGLKLGPYGVAILTRRG